MPFVCILEKGAVSHASAVDAQRLEALLCPYAGEIRRVPLSHGPRGELLLSRLAGPAAPSGRSQVLGTFPAKTARGPQTAWLEISAEDGGLRFETDPLGTFPLWIFEDDRRVVITGEVKALLALENVRIDFKPGDTADSDRRPPDFTPYRNVRRVAPGAVLHVTAQLETVQERRTPLTYRPASMLATREEQSAELDAALQGSARSIGAGEGEWATFLSGGIDSSTATSLLAKLRPGLRTFTLGTEHGDEYADAEDLAGHLGTRHARVFVESADALRHFERAVFCNETIDGLTAETLAQLRVLAEAAAPTVRHVVTGYGADLLFGSMLRHELYMKVTGVNDLASLIERTCWSGEFAPFYAWSLGVEIHHLFWDPALMNTAFRIPPEASFDGTHEKIVLRELAVARGYMERRHAFRKKQALTDGTQFNRVLSSSLGLASPHAYDEKNAACVSVLSKLYQA